VTLFANLAAALAPGGVLVAQCGGAGNIAAINRFADRVIARAPFAAASTGVRSAYNFAAPEETHARLAAAGFVAIETWLEPQPVGFATAAEFGAFIQTVALRPYLAALPEDLLAAFVDAVVEEDEHTGGKRTVDYVRLNMSARRSQNAAASAPA